MNFATRGKVLARTFTGGLLLTTLGSVAALADKPPQEWDGLQRVKGKLDNIYLRPGINFAGYTAIRIIAGRC